MGRIRPRIASAIKTYGVDVEIRWFDTSTPCPCTQNPWKKYDAIWHQNNPEAESCGGTGKLTPVNSETVRAVVMPRYSMIGEEVTNLSAAGSYEEWDWAAFLTDTVSASELILTDGKKFNVVGDFPYFVEQDTDLPAVRILLLTQQARKRLVANA